MRVAVLTCERLPAFVTWEIPDVDALFDDDHRLVAALEGRGVHAERVAWTDAAAEWAAFDAAVIRSTWDYVDRPAAFTEVVAAVEASGCLLLNAAEPVTWNCDKARYLADLERWGVPVVPTLRVPAGDAAAAELAADAAGERGWRSLVVKPAVGVGASGVRRVGSDDLRAELEAWATGDDLLVQPFVESVADEGELSFVVVGGEIAHVLRKRPAQGDFRAHGIYGGTVERVDAARADRAQVEAMHGRQPFDLAYARYDVLRVDGELAVVEFEAVEPMLYLALAPESAGALADEILARVGDGRAP